MIILYCHYQNTSIVHFPDFETGVLTKVILTQDKINVLKHFEVGNFADLSIQVTRESKETFEHEIDAEKWVRVTAESNKIKFTTQ